MTDSRIRYYFRISRGDLILREGTMLWEEAWSLSQKLCPCTVEVL